MSGFALLLYLFFFFLIPLSEVIWIRSLHSSLVLHIGGTTILNAGYYLNMAGCWIGCLGVSWILAWFLHRDDPEGWQPLLTYVDRKPPFALADFILCGLFAGALVWCLVNGKPYHSVMTSGAAVLGTLVIGPWMGKQAGGGNRKDKKSAADLAKQQPEEPEKAASVLAPPRELNDDEPRPIEQEKVSLAVLRAAEMGSASDITLLEYQIKPPDPESNMPPEEPYTISFHVDNQEYLTESALARPATLKDAAEVIQSKSRTPVIRDVVRQLGLDDNRYSPRYRVKKALDFARGLEDIPAPDGRIRFPLETLVEKQATASERSWLAAALLESAGFHTALWLLGWNLQSDCGVAIANVFQAEHYLSGCSAQDNNRNLRWFFVDLNPSRARPDLALCPLDERAAVRSHG